MAQHLHLLKPPGQKYQQHMCDRFPLQPFFFFGLNKKQTLFSCRQMVRNPGLPLSLVSHLAVRVVSSSLAALFSLLRRPGQAGGEHRMHGILPGAGVHPPWVGPECKFRPALRSEWRKGFPLKGPFLEAEVL